MIAAVDGSMVDAIMLDDIVVEVKMVDEIILDGTMVDNCFYKLVLEYDRGTASNTEIHLSMTHLPRLICVLRNNQLSINMST